MSKEEPDFVFDFNRVTYREILELDLTGGDDEEEDEEKNEQKNREASDETLGLIVRVLVKWPHDAEPTVDSIKDLGLTDFASLQKSFSAAMKGIFR